MCAVILSTDGPATRATHSRGGLREDAHHRYITENAPAAARGCRLASRNHVFDGHARTEGEGLAPWGYLRGTVWYSLLQDNNRP